MTSFFKIVKLRPPHPDMPYAASLLISLKELITDSHKTVFQFLMHLFTVCAQLGWKLQGGRGEGYSGSLLLFVVVTLSSLDNAEHTFGVQHIFVELMDTMTSFLIFTNPHAGSIRADKQGGGKKPK